MRTCVMLLYPPLNIRHHISRGSFHNLTTDQTDVLLSHHYRGNWHPYTVYFSTITLPGPSWLLNRQAGLHWTPSSRKQWQTRWPPLTSSSPIWTPPQTTAWTWPLPRPTLSPPTSRSLLHYPGQTTKPSKNQTGQSLTYTQHSQGGAVTPDQLPPWGLGSDKPESKVGC